MTDLDRIWDNGWGKALIYFAELDEKLRRPTDGVNPDAQHGDGPVKAGVSVVYGGSKSKRTDALLAVPKEADRD